MRKSGVLMHITSLPSDYGIGTMGKEAFGFIDFLEAAGQSYWQILPVGPTGYGDSPYQTTSTYAGNPYFIDLDVLAEAGLIDKTDYADEDWGPDRETVDYGKLYEKRFAVLNKASDKFLESPDEDFYKFCEENKFWLDDYALFASIKASEGAKPWNMWPEDLKRRDSKALSDFSASHSKEINRLKVIQFLFWQQWEKMHEYASSKGISIIGDVPIYCAYDSVECWAHPELFLLDEKLEQTEVAGCPPDGFSELGQRWGNPLYDWEYHEKTGFEWWTDRINHLCNVYDVLRIDHFRGFDSFYAIPSECPDARIGQWREGPGIKLFEALEKRYGKKRVIAEDLGFLTDSVRKLLKDSGFPGMKVLQFGFDIREGNHSDYLPHRYIENSIAYTGTHDNDTINGWILDCDENIRECACDYMNISDLKTANVAAMKTLWASPAGVTVVQAQDLLGLGSEARMNIPATSEGNWKWRALPGVFDEALAEKMDKWMLFFERRCDRDLQE